MTHFIASVVGCQTQHRFCTSQEEGSLKGSYRKRHHTSSMSFWQTICCWHMRLQISLCLVQESALFQSLPHCRRRPFSSPSLNHLKKPTLKRFMDQSVLFFRMGP